MHYSTYFSTYYFNCYLSSLYSLNNKGIQKSKCKMQNDPVKLGNGAGREKFKKEYKTINIFTLFSFYILTCYFDFCILHFDFYL
jgi:hypothetical protein